MSSLLNYSNMGQRKASSIRRTFKEIKLPLERHETVFEVHVLYIEFGSVLDSQIQSLAAVRLRLWRAVFCIFKACSRGHSRVTGAAGPLQQNRSISAEKTVIQLLEHFTTFKAQIKYSLKTSYGQFQVWIPLIVFKCSESPFLFRSTLQLRQEDIEEISNETGFTQPQIERLYHRLTTDLYHQFVTILTFYIVIRFTSLDKSNQGFLTREDFLRFIVLTRSMF